MYDSYANPTIVNLIKNMMNDAINHQ
jgi:hypothetical protein